MITLNQVRFLYDQTPVVREVSFHVPKGSIFGFAGPNGAGKTTTLKLILGLLQPATGSIRIRNLDLAHHRKEVLSKTGSLIETPSLYPHLTAAENLEISRRVYKVPGSRIDEVLSLTGIHPAKHKKVKAFSLGMKQRLGIALALLHDPDLLILDEPINGLDPGGILEFRDLLKSLVEEKGLTVLISSHILSELELVITHAGIIAEGSIRFHGTMADLQSLSRSRLILEVSDPASAADMITKITPCYTDQSHLIIPDGNRDLAAHLVRELTAAGQSVYQVVADKPNLESVFHELIRKDPEHV